MKPALRDDTPAPLQPRAAWGVRPGAALAPEPAAAPPPATRLQVGTHMAELACEPDPPELARDAWGFADSRMALHADRTVTLSGDRYELSLAPMPYVVPWIEGVLGLPLEPAFTPPASGQAAAAPARLDPALAAALADRLGPGQVSTDPWVRRRHGHGHAQSEIFALNFAASAPRAPDVVAFAASQADVEAVVELAARHGACVIPYGGGTSVTEALKVPGEEARTVISLDLGRMDRLVWIDPVNRLACIEAGALGRHIAPALGQYGLTLGHEPDSMEFSSLGGWIATSASGMKKNRYGNIEDIVLDVTVVGAQGVVSRSNAAPRESVGVDVRRLMLGSEGRLGVVTQAVVRLADLPERQGYDSVLFADLDAGIEFMYALSQGESLPASVRLVDNMQFHFGLAMRSADRGSARWRRRLASWWLRRGKGFDPGRMVACTLLFEGSHQEVRRQRRQVMGLARQLGGLRAGARNGQRGYQLTFGIAYIRDFVMRYGIVAESFETSVAWSCVASLIEQVRRRVMREHRSRGLPGRPVLMSRVTQVYATGACVYFYLGLYLRGVAQPAQVFAEVEAAARDEILLAGGSLSHHHGVGKLRQGWLRQVMSPASLTWSSRAKDALDPHNIFGCGNQQYR